MQVERRSCWDTEETRKQSSAEKLAISTKLPCVLKRFHSLMEPIVHDLRVYLSLADGVSVFLLSPLALLWVEVQGRRQSTPLSSVSRLVGAGCTHGCQRNQHSYQQGRWKMQRGFAGRWMEEGRETTGWLRTGRSVLRLLTECTLWLKSQGLWSLTLLLK